MNTPEATYHSFNSAELVVRYAALRDMVAGKRVLDIGCGEGHGCRLMLDWGARAVVGIETDAQAVATAQRLYDGEDLSLLQGEVEQLESILSGAEQFDVIVCFQTVEHLDEPETFLKALPALLVEGGLMLIGCRNEAAYRDQDDSGPDGAPGVTAFRVLVEAHLGAADAWLMGTPILGMANVAAGDDFVELPHHDRRSMTKTRSVENAVQIPAQYNLVTTPETCAHVIGIWGGAVPTNVVLSSLSVPGYFEPWKTIGWLRRRVAHLEANQKTEATESERLQAVIGDFERLSLQLSQAPLDSRDSEIARLKSLCDNQAERLATHTAQRQVIADLQRQLDESRALINDWYVPEISRLKETVETHEKVKREWWEPQLEARAERIRVLEAALAGAADEGAAQQPPDSGAPARIVDPD